MSDSVILAVGVFAFVMALTGVLLTVIEFRRTVHPKRVRRNLDRTVKAGDMAKAHAR